MGTFPHYDWHYMESGTLKATGDFPFTNVQGDGVVLFANYDDAVKAEVSFIQRARAQGLNHLVSDQ